MTSIKVLPSFFREGDIILDPFDPPLVPDCESFFIIEKGEQVGVASLDKIHVNHGTARLMVCGNDIIGPYTGFELVATRILLRYAFEARSFERVITSACEYETALVECAVSCGFEVTGVKEVSRPDSNEPYLVWRFAITKERWYKTRVVDRWKKILNKPAGGKP